MRFSAKPTTLAIAHPDALLVRVAAGERGAVEACIARYGGLVWSLARRFTRTPADAEDATQEIFLNLWTHAKAFDAGRGSEIGFVATLARRRLVDRCRRLNRELDIDKSFDLEDAADAADASATCQVSLDAETAAQVLGTLRAEWRAVLELGLLEGLTQTEISQRLNLPLGTVKSHMRRGLLQVRDALNGRDAPSLADELPAPRGKHGLARFRAAVPGAAESVGPLAPVPV